MTDRKLKNIAASARSRLRNRSRETGEDSMFLLHRYAAERFLFRLGQSAHRENYVLKGAMLFPLWGGSLYRATRDLDFMGYGSSDVEVVLTAMREICQLPVEDDGLRFDASAIAAAPIREEAEYNGQRLRFHATLGNTRIPMQIDVGFGNAIEPAANDVQYPTLLDSPAPSIRAYPKEAVVAEKLHAMVVLGERNSRFKDFYDLYVLAEQFPFDGKRLAGAVAATFRRRRTTIHAAIPVAVTPRFFEDGARADQWSVYLARNALPSAPSNFAAIGELLRAFLVPVLGALMTRRAFDKDWAAGGQWIESTPSREPRE